MIFTDESLVQQFNELKKFDEYKTNVLRSVTHELRTPLHGIFSMLQCAIQDAKVLESTKSEYLQGALNQGELLLYLLNDILDFSQLDTNQFRLKIEITDVLSLGRKAITLLR